MWSKITICLVLILLILSGCTTTQDPLEVVVVEADYIVYGTITDVKYKTVPQGESDASGSIYTLYTLSVEKVIKGDPAAREVFIKAAGGKGQDVIQIPIEVYFPLASQVLVCLQREGDVYRVLIYPPGPDGTFAIEGSHAILWGKGDTIYTVNKLEDIIDRVVQIMKDNNILQASSLIEMPQLPAGSVSSPTK